MQHNWQQCIIQLLDWADGDKATSEAEIVEKLRVGILVGYEYSPRCTNSKIVGGSNLKGLVPKNWTSTNWRSAGERFANWPQAVEKKFNGVRPMTALVLGEAESNPGRRLA